MEKLLDGEWSDFLREEYKKDYFLKLEEYLDNEYSSNVCYPPADEIFTAFKLTELSSVKVCILGQDPYHNRGEAHGLAFSVKEGIKIPPSLKNIYKELETDCNITPPLTGNLTPWARQGVFMLNTVLTVRDGEANSHKGQGWEIFTDNVIKKLNAIDRPLVFMLWGAPSIKKAKMLDNPKHLVLTSAHPSPLSAYRGFFGCKHFSSCNEFLVKNNLCAIDWQI